MLKNSTLALRGAGFNATEADGPTLPDRELCLFHFSRIVLAPILLALLFSTCTLAESASDIYKKHCAPCHGANGAADTMIGKNLKMRSLTSPEVQNQSDQQLDAVTSRGKNKMPAYDRKLSKEQIAALVKYIRSLNK